MGTLVYNMGKRCYRGRVASFVESKKRDTFVEVINDLRRQ